MVKNVCGKTELVLTSFLFMLFFEACSFKWSLDVSMSFFGCLSCVVMDLRVNAAGLVG